MTQSNQKFSGDLKRISNGLKNLNGDGITLALNRAAVRINADIETKFLAQQDPHGTPWIDRVGKQSWPINNHSGYLKNSRVITIEGHSLRVTYPVDYSVYVNAVRPLIPSTVPESWKQIVAEELDKVIKGIK